MVTRGERGSALIWVLGFIVTLGIVISASQFLARIAERQMFARNSVSQTELAAASAVEALTDRVRSTVANRLGNLSPADLLAINVQASSLPFDLETTGATVQNDTLLTGVRIVDVREGEVIPHDETVLGVWTHQPRVSYDGIPDVGGSVAMRTIELEVYATAHGPREGRRMVTRRVAVSVIVPHQHALYTQGDAEIAATGSSGVVGGPVRVDGTAYFGSGNLMTYVGGIEARDGISAVTGLHQVAGTTYPGGAPSLASLTRTGSELDPAAMLAPWQGRVRIRPSVGGSVAPGRMQTSSVAGTGECLDFGAACFGRGSFRPGITLRRLTTGHGTEYSYTCGEAYHDDGSYTCGTVARAPAITYLPWPFSDPLPPPGKAAAHPARPDSIWKGFFPDFRRETSCDATDLVGGRSYPTFRCPTNAYGYQLDIGALPAILGGVIAVRREAAPRGGHEIVLIRNGALLAGPLTLVSEVPVVIWGNFNVVDPKPAMISAPRITVMPEQSAEQLQASMYWDRVDGSGSGIVSPAAPVRAESDVTIYAVLRSGYCRSIGGAYFGGSYEGVPATYGDWSRGALRVAGAVEGYDETYMGAAACASYWAPILEAQPGGVYLAPPYQRSVLFNRRLLHPAGQPPGSWQWENFYYSGSIPGAPTRTQRRQQDAVGGTTVLRLIQDLRTIPPSARGSTFRPRRDTVIDPIPLPIYPQAL